MSLDEKIFLSYNRKDSGFSLKLAQDLKSSGVNIWVDQYDIAPGTRWDVEIQKALFSCQALLIVLSPQSIRSDNVLDELNHAIERRKTVYPVMAEHCNEDEIPFRLKRFEYVDFTNDYDLGLSRLLYAITGKPFVPPSPPVPELSLKITDWIRAHLIVVILLLVLLTVGGREILHLLESNEINKANGNLENSQPAVTGAGNLIYFFVRSPQGDVYFNFAELTHSFSGWQKMSNNVPSESSPSACSVANYLYIVMADRNGDTFLNQGGGSPFLQWASLNFRTDLAIAVAGVANKVYFFAGKADGTIYYNWAVSNQGGVGWAKLPGNPHANSPPAAGSVNGEIFVVVRNKDNTLSYNQATNGASFNQEWLTMSFKIEGTPAVIGAGNSIYFFAKGSNRSIYYTTASLGSSFDDWRPINSTVPLSSFSSPSVGAIGNYIFISVLGEDGRLYYSQGSAGGTLTDWLPMNLPF